MWRGSAISWRKTCSESGTRTKDWLRCAARAGADADAAASSSSAARSALTARRELCDVTLQLLVALGAQVGPGDVAVLVDEEGGREPEHIVAGGQVPAGDENGIGHLVLAHE